MDYTKSFTRAELACKCGCGLMRPAPGFLDRLQELRDKFGHPMTLNSACRCTPHNAKVGGKPKSYHVGDADFRDYGFCAVDVAFPADHPLRGDFIEEAARLGWTIGMHRRFVHVDLRSVYASVPPIVFDY